MSKRKTPSRKARGVYEIRLREKDGAPMFKRLSESERKTPLVDEEIKTLFVALREWQAARQQPDWQLNLS